MLSYGLADVVMVESPTAADAAAAPASASSATRNATTAAVTRTHPRAMMRPAPAYPSPLTLAAAKDMMAAAKKLAAQAEQAANAAAAAAKALKEAEEAVKALTTAQSTAHRGKRSSSARDPAQNDASGEAEEQED